MSIFTGHTSVHLPHSDEAKLKCLNSLMLFIFGVITDPIGPLYVVPYAWPPTPLYIGQAFKHAPQRMQLSALRCSTCASNSLRPLSSNTTYISSGPSLSPGWRGPGLM